MVGPSIFIDVDEDYANYGLFEAETEKLVVIFDADDLPYEERLLMMEEKKLLMCYCLEETCLAFKAKWMMW